MMKRLLALCMTLFFLLTPISVQAQGENLEIFPDNLRNFWVDNHHEHYTLRVATSDLFNYLADPEVTLMDLATFEGGVLLDDFLQNFRYTLPARDEVLRDENAASVEIIYENENEYEQDTVLFFDFYGEQLASISLYSKDRPRGERFIFPYSEFMLLSNMTQSLDQIAARGDLHLLGYTVLKYDGVYDYAVSFPISNPDRADRVEAAVGFLAFNKDHFLGSSYLKYEDLQVSNVGRDNFDFLFNLVYPQP